MYCKCGCPDEMLLHKVQRNLKIVAIWLKCACCGRIHWRKKDEL